MPEKAFHVAPDKPGPVPWLGSHPTPLWHASDRLETLQDRDRDKLFRGRQAEVGHWLRRGPWCFPTGSDRGLGRYTVQSYRRAIVRAQERAGVNPWTPHQLRHARGQLVRDSIGLEAAQAVLGHSSIDATQLYAGKVLQEGRRAALALG